MSAGGDGSTKVIVIAFFANLGISMAKFGGALFSGSASLMAESIHSLVDSTNQVLLLVGAKKSVKPADEKHPLGYGREAFFWSFIVAMLLFSLGGLFAIYEGVHKFHQGGEVNAPLLGIGILLVSLILEGYSFFACLKEVRAQNQYGSLWAWFKHTKSSELLVIFTEDAAAMVGLLIATVCLSLAWWSGNTQWDAIGSIMVGTILVVVAVLLGIEVKSFIIGEASSNDIKVYIENEVPKFFDGGKMLKLIAIQTGSNEVMVSFKVFPGHSNDLNLAIDQVNRLEVKIKRQWPAIKWLFVELDKEA